MFKEYIEYFKDNPKGLWFKRKLYGWGWTPVTWQGWLVTLTFIGFILWTGVSLSASGEEPTDTELKWYFIKIVGAVILLIIIAYKTGEKPRWQWGVPKKNDSKKNSDQNENMIKK